MVEKILNNTTPYGKIRASHEGSLHSSTLNQFQYKQNIKYNSNHISRNDIKIPVPGQIIEVVIETTNCTLT